MKLNLNTITLQDCYDGLKKLPDECTDIVICDPPYNIGKDFGNDSDQKEFNEYISWMKKITDECIRILKPSGTLYCYGFSEILAHISVNIPLQQRWLIWHYTNKNTPTATFWQRSHESIIMAWKDKSQRIFNLDDVREPYTESFLKNAAGKVRKATPGRFSKSDQETVYNANEKGAMPRDVLKIPALAGGAGKNERFFYCVDCDDVFSNNEKDQHSDHEMIQHPTQKPCNLTERLIKAAMPKKDGLLVVPFAGSGVELAVAKKLKLNFIAFELNQKYVNMGKALLKKFNIIKYK